MWQQKIDEANTPPLPLRGWEGRGKDNIILRPLNGVLLLRAPRDSGRVFFSPIFIQPAVFNGAVVPRKQHCKRQSPCCSVWWTKSMFPSPISVNYFWIMSLSIFFFCIHYYPFFLWQVVSIHSFTGPRKIPKVVWKMSLPDFMRRCWQKIGN